MSESGKGQLFSNPPGTDRQDEPLWDLLLFERLLSDLSTRFINLPASEVDKEIIASLKKLVNFLAVDRGNLAQFSEDMSIVHITHSWAAEGVKPVPPTIDLKPHFPWNRAHKVLRNEYWMFSRIEDLPQEAVNEKQFFLCEGIKSHLTLPLMVGGSILGWISFGTVWKERIWPRELIPRLRIVGEIFANALVRQRGEVKLQNAFTEIKQLKERLEKENINLREEIKLKYSYEEIIGQSEAIKGILSQVERVAQTDSTVLITGETGTGKELIARAIHKQSRRKDRPMVKVNCAALPSTLLECELFGREKGAYTGALCKQTGRFEIADKSTIFLDEIGDLPLELQVKLLGVLQDGKFERLGSSKTISVDVRVIAATNRDVARAVQEGRFRQDLYYRLNVFPVCVPPLRDRPEDIPLMVWAFLRFFGETMGKRIEVIPRKCIEAMQRYSWPGNVRELKNVIERGMIVSREKTLLVQIPESSAMAGFQDLTLEESSRRHITSVLQKTRWRVSGCGGAATLLGLKPTTLESKMKKLGLKRPAN